MKDPMEIKNLNEITALCFTSKVTLKALQQFVRVKARELYQEAIKKDLEITGPVYWIYQGMDGNPDTEFTLDIAIPVADGNSYSGKFSIKKLEKFKCLSYWHYGSWSALPSAYGQIFQEINSKSLIPTGEFREIYQVIDFTQDTNNVTEVQAGIQ
jgi:effector-binding domain-containing protein